MTAESPYLFNLKAVARRLPGGAGNISGSQMALPPAPVLRADSQSSIPGLSQGGALAAPFCFSLPYCTRCQGMCRCLSGARNLLPCRGLSGREGGFCRWNGLAVGFLLRLLPPQPPSQGDSYPAGETQSTEQVGHMQNVL